MALLALGWFLVQSGCAASQATEEPTVVLISIDGFHPSYLNPTDSPALSAIASEGVRAEYMVPVFPSKTFPSHYSLITGLYPANHGIISNQMVDAELGVFRPSNRAAMRDGRWWGGEPLWVTVEKAGRSSTVNFWVGSEAEINGYRPSSWREFDNSWPHRDRIEAVQDALLESPRPALITAYFSTVDTQGHRHGPDSDEVRSAVREVDARIGDLVDWLAARDLTGAVNLVVVSDHGMVTTSSERVSVLDPYVDFEDVSIVELDPVTMLNVNEGVSVEDVLERLHGMPSVSWYLADAMPPEFHFTGHRRIPDLIGIADIGWRIGRQSRLEGNPAFFDGGSHGYPPWHPSMHALFVARGPQFKRAREVSGFDSIHLYELLCAALGLQPAPNDGSLDAVRHMLAEPD